MKFLPPLPGVADNMGDLFQPEDCQDEPVGRRGRIQHRTRGIVEIAMFAHSPLDTGGLLVLSRPTPKDEWEVEVDLGGDHFRSELPNLLNFNP